MTLEYVLVWTLFFNFWKYGTQKKLNSEFRRIENFAKINSDKAGIIGKNKLRKTPSEIQK